MSTSKGISVVEQKTLFLVRGLPGSGKTSLAKLLFDHNVAADEYFDLFYGGRFEPSKLPSAHSWCQSCAKRWMQQQVDKIAVHNTFTRIREMRPYFALAQQYNYKVFTLVVENRHGSYSIHDVPVETLDRMEGRFDIQLRPDQS